MNRTQVDSLTDQIINTLDNGLRSTFARPKAKRQSPATQFSSDPIADNNALKQRSASLMRVNHVGEVCAQALYQGQAMTAKTSDVKKKMHEAAQEELDHLSWCDERINELGGRTSLLNPLWYIGSLAMGATAGAIGDKWSLGFLEETENQVEQHLAEHLNDLPESDHRSRAIVEQMKLDEAKHAQMAHDNGATELPKPVKQIMRSTANMMKFIAAKI